MEKSEDKKKQFVICVENEGYEVSLERRKIYEALPDPDAEKHGQIRVIDESGEDYLYPKNWFVRLEPPSKVAGAVFSKILPEPENGTGPFDAPNESKTPRGGFHGTQNQCPGRPPQ